MVMESTVVEKKINEFVQRARQAAGENLQSVILYGSAASADFHPDYSHIDLLCVVRETSLAALQSLAATVQWWTRQKQPAPIVMTRAELERSAGVFAIEVLDMQRRHRVLFGDDPLSGLRVSPHAHLAQVRYEIPEKLLLLRRHVLTSAGSARRRRELLLHSLPSFLTLIRHAAMVLGEAEDGRRDAIDALARKIDFDPTVFHQLLDLRDNKAQWKDFEVSSLCSRYLAALEQIAAGVDKMIGPDPYAVA
jgi:predicted nucleotidyltransferase